MMSRNRRPVAAAVGALVLGGVLSGCGLIGQPKNSSAELSEWFTVISPAFRDGGELPTRFGCTTYSGNGAQGKTPPLQWSGTPTETKSFAIVVDDPDASDGAYVHWVAAGLEANRTSLVEGGRQEKMVEGLNTGKKVNYLPPCPPKGEKHRYRFTIYALDTAVPFKNGATLQEALGAIAEHTIGRGRITGNFGSG